jgi:hypothetical protein
VGPVIVKWFYLKNTNIFHICTMASPEEIFTPGGIPTFTYVIRDEDKYEDALKKGLNTKGFIVSVAGPSKSGKTVLINRVISADELIPITGAGMNNPEEIWDRVLDWMKVPTATQREIDKRFSGHLDIEAKASAGILLAKAETSGKMGGKAERGTTKREQFNRRGMTQVIADIADSSYVIFVDDFHYMERSIQAEAARQLKDAAGKGVKICIALVKHRGDDVVRANPELRGRIRAIDFNYWSIDNLCQIAYKGFAELNLSIDESSINYFAMEAGGSPQLMQAICLETCRHLKIEGPKDGKTPLILSKETQTEIMLATSVITDFSSLCEVLDSGPRTRGVERKEYQFKDGQSGDVYRCVLKAMAANPPALSFTYEDLLNRLESICQGNSPGGASVIGTCEQMNTIARDKFPNERVIDWDGQKSIMEVSDPYFIFYLRWSDYLKKPAR